MKEEKSPLSLGVGTTRGSTCEHISGIYLDIIRYLLSAGVSVKLEHNVHEIVIHGDVEILKYLN